ncbi:hypothetical protein B296_00040774 [Ensete ventricosum]|uniref:Retrotransposon gag domain-containing protein n=1 Tax=Ensete ventricosum TaxID=4639 RepID=A0A426ZPA6_ENSVE|nr:hypothetical protein B296_00040774 [Ensete ventricosum]
MQPPATFLELLQEANRHIVVESVIIRKRNSEPKVAKDERSTWPNNLEPPRNDRPRGDQAPPHRKFTPSNTSHIEVFMRIREKGFLRAPRLRTPPTKQSHTKFCRFHQDHEHDMNNCYDLKL